MKSLLVWYLPSILEKIRGMDMSIDKNLTEEQKKLKIQRLIGNLTRLAKNNPALRTALLGIKNPLTPWHRKTQPQPTKTKAVELLPTITPPPNQPPDPLKPTQEEHAALMNTASSSHHQPKTLEALAAELLNNTTPTRSFRING